MSEYLSRCPKIKRFGEALPEGMSPVGRLRLLTKRTPRVKSQGHPEQGEEEGAVSLSSLTFVIIKDIY